MLWRLEGEREREREMERQEEPHNHIEHTLQADLFKLLPCPDEKCERSGIDVGFVLLGALPDSELDATCALTPPRPILRRPSNAAELMQQRCSEARDPTSSIEGASAATRVADQQSQPFTFVVWRFWGVRYKCVRVFVDQQSQLFTFFVWRCWGSATSPFVSSCHCVFMSSCVWVGWMDGRMD